MCFFYSLFFFSISFSFFTFLTWLVSFLSRCVLNIQVIWLYWCSPRFCMQSQQTHAHTKKQTNERTHKNWVSVWTSERALNETREIGNNLILRLFFRHLLLLLLRASFFFSFRSFYVIFSVLVCSKRTNDVERIATTDTGTVGDAVVFNIHILCSFNKCNPEKCSVYNCWWFTSSVRLLWWCTCGYTEYRSIGSEKCAIRMDVCTGKKIQSLLYSLITKLKQMHKWTESEWEWEKGRKNKTKRNWQINTRTHTHTHMRVHSKTTATTLTTKHSYYTTNP